MDSLTDFKIFDFYDLRLLLYPSVILRVCNNYLYGLPILKPFTEPLKNVLICM